MKNFAFLVRRRPEIWPFSGRSPKNEKRPNSKMPIDQIKIYGHMS